MKYANPVAIAKNIAKNDELSNDYKISILTNLQDDCSNFDKTQIQYFIYQIKTNPDSKVKTEIEN